MEGDLNIDWGGITRVDLAVGALRKVLYHYIRKKEGERLRGNHGRDEMGWGTLEGKKNNSFSRSGGLHQLIGSCEHLGKGHWKGVGGGSFL